MGKKEIITIICLVGGFLIGRALVYERPNSEARYSNGFPANCRALVQANIDGWRSGAYKPDEAMASLERNCGAYGTLWDAEED